MNGPRQREGQLGPLELLVLGAAVSVLVVEGGLWLWAGTAGALFGTGWPQLSLDVLWHGIGGIARHLSDPREGFPVRVRAGLPGPNGFYGALVIVVILLGVMIAGAVMVWQRVRPTGGGGFKRHGARWAGGSDLARLRRRRQRAPATAGATANGRRDDVEVLGLSLGYRGLRLLRGEERHALVVFGPAQSGKSAGLAIPNILEWSGPEIVVSVKPDLLDATISARGARGGAGVRSVRPVGPCEPRVVAAGQLPDVEPGA